ncbi:hypothetical protein Tco_0030664 [Tanacetum coccineum]
MSEGSKNSGSFKDSGRSDEEYSEDRASFKEGGSETPQLRRSTRVSRAPVSEGTLSLKKILGAKNPADMLTKVVTTQKLKLCAASTGLRDN